ncbi:hypothetical protein [Variimorphobacter saccharofermentans]|uniref:hypothetical protein n=1 Tax=Variimorphobacter saccharofermentans TaxID=2755051 RepID=UPI001E5A8902|nr:hypothetical protein [Variimorphobacter saccharofermentans]
MDRTSSNPLGRIFLSDNIIHADNVLIEKVVVESARTGYILTTLELSDENSVIYMQETRLNVGEYTIIIDESGRRLNLYDLQEGMRIDAYFSSAMTRSIPPQSSAFSIIVLQEEATVDITTDRVVNVDTNYGFIITGNPYDIYDQMIFTVSDDTVILDQSNNTIPLEAIQPGQLVQVEHAIFQTLSIPPQSPAYRVMVL